MQVNAWWQFIHRAEVSGSLAAFLVDAMIFIQHEVFHDEYRGYLDTEEMLALTGYTLESRTD